MRSLAFVSSLVLACGGAAPPSAEPTPSPLPSSAASAPVAGPTQGCSAPDGAAATSDMCLVGSSSASASPSASPPAPERPPRVAVLFELATPGAEVRLVKGADERVIASFPVRVNFDTSQTWEVRAKKRGYCPLVQKLDFDHPTVRIELRRGCL